MTDSNAIHSTITKQPEPTKFSNLESKAASKDEFLKSFTGGKLRKNAKKKIAQLLAYADTVTLKTQSMGMDDCYRSNEPVSMPKSDFWAWYEREYSDMVIMLTVQDGVLTCAKFCDCIYHFSNDVVMTFSLGELDAEKVIFDNDSLEAEEAEEVNEPVQLAPFEQYEHLVKTAVVKQVVVDWSESNQFDENESYTLEAYNEKSMIEAVEVGRGNGYAKTMLTIIFDDGHIEKLRHDIDADYPTLNHYYAAIGLIKLQSATKPRFTFEQVTQALIDGYLSPLNHNQKHPEPTPPTDESKTRKVASLGDYQERIESKKERLEARAEKAKAQSNARFDIAHQLGSVLPFGQPILVGHHSEGKHRRLIENIDNNMRKSVEAQDKADYLETKAASVGSAGIASDDPEAIQKLKDKLANLERSQEMMKAINKVIRSKHMSNTDKVEYMTQTHQLTEKHAAELLEGDFCGRVGFPSYALQNNNATIRSTKQRIEELEKLHNDAPLDEAGEVEGVNWTLYEEDGRIKFSFDGIPAEAVRSLLKSNGFKWSRYSKAWVRKMTANAVHSTHSVINELKVM